MKKLLSVILALALALSLTCASAVTLRKGSTGTLVKRVQQFLNDNGYASLTVDGVYGTGTMDAVKRYQSINGLTVDGYAGTRTLKAMGINTNTDPTGEADDDEDDDVRVCQIGSKGSNVKAIQTALKTLGYPVGSADGAFGSKTRTAVIYFQKLNNLTADGKVGPKTYARLMSSDATPYNASFNSDKTYTTLRTGSSGSKVKKLQTALSSLGYDVNITSYYDSVTKAAVKSFQQDYSLTADGIAGKETQAQIYAITGVDVT